MDLINIYYLHEKGEKKNQEDYIWPTAGNAKPDSSVLIICDGVGGSENGEVASRIVAETVGNLLTGRKENEISPEYVKHALLQAKKELITYSQEHKLSLNMATTFCLCALFPGKAFIAWCGDSRVYHIRNGDILFRTEDHSLVNTLVKSGEISEDEAKQHPASNIILKAINADDTPIEADYHRIESVMTGDYFLLCTDGLLENITGDDLRYVLSREKNDSTSILDYIQQKCKDKTRDNYSMYLVQVEVKKTRKNKPLLISLLVILAVIFSVVLFMRSNTTSQLPSLNPDSLDQVRAGTKSAEYPVTKDSHKADSLQEFEIVSVSDSTESNTSPLLPTAKDTAASGKARNNKKKSKKPVPSADSNNTKPTN